MPEHSERAATFLDMYATRGAFGTERGKVKNLLHLQGAAEIRAPPPEDKGPLLVTKMLRCILQIPTGQGWKITVKYFRKTQLPSAMIGYTMKDKRQAWFNYVCKGLSKRDLAKAAHDYLSIRRSYSWLLDLHS